MAEEVADGLEYPNVVPMLICVKAWCDQPSVSVSDCRMGMDAYTEAAFAIDKSCYVIWSQTPMRPSLLMIPTRRIVTEHVDIIASTYDIIRYREMRGTFQHIAEFYNGL